MSSTMSSSTHEWDSMQFIPEIDETPISLEDILSIDLNRIDDGFSSGIDDDFDTTFLEYGDDSSLHHLCVSELPFVKTQILNATQSNINSGNPTCLTCSKNLIIVGTFHGHILIFDNQRVKMFLKHESSFGTISAMTINPDETRLLCGGGRGGVSLWSIESGENLRVVDNIHASFSSVIALKYASDVSYAILADTSGSVFFLDTRKKDFESNCVFTGSRGEVLAVQPLILNRKEEKEAFYGIEPICMVAMSTVSKVIVVSLRPNLFVHFTFQLKGRPEYLPLLAWNFTFKLEKPHLLLMFGRENQIYIHHVDTSGDDKIYFQPFYRFQTHDYTIQNMFWIEEDTILLMDTNEKCHLVDFGDELEIIDVSHIGLVYERANYKSLINGGYVSKAMAKAGEHACINSITYRHTASRVILYFLGMKSVYEMKLQTWQERIDYFITNNLPLRALQIANEELSYINSDEQNIRDEILDKLELALQSFENIAFDKGLTKSKDQSKIKSVLKIILKYIFCLKDKEDKVQELFERFDGSSTGKECLIECLEEFILSNQLPNLNPILVAEIVDHYLKKDWNTLLDTLITRIDIINLDLNYLMNVCFDRELYDTYLYINNVAFQEYITPFDELLKVLQSHISSKDNFSKTDILLGNKLLVYLCSMLTCCNYPNKGPIEPEKESEHLEKIYDRLMRCNSDGQSDVLNILFKFDPVEYFNVILIAFEYVHGKHPEAQWKQNLIDFYIVRILIQNEQFDCEQRIAFYIFLSRCLITFNNVEMSKNHFLMLINCLFAERNVKKFEERQQMLIQLFEHSFRKQFYPEKEFLKNAFACDMFRICDFIHRKNSEWNELFRIYLLDQEKKDEVFDYIQTVMSLESVASNSRNTFLELVFSSIRDLIKINSSKSVALFFAHYDGNHTFYERLLTTLQPDPDCLFKFLKLTICRQRKKLLNSPDDVSKAIVELSTNPKYQELCIELACKLKSPDLISYISLFVEADKHKILESCQQYSMKDGEALVYEYLNEHKQSFEILFTEFKARVAELIELCFNDLLEWKTHYNFKTIEKSFETLLNFCVRCFKNSLQNAQSFCLETLEYLIEINTNLNKIESNKFDKLDEYFSNFKLQEYSQESIALVKLFNKDFRTIFEQLLNTMINWMNSMEFFAVIRDKILQQSEDFMDLKEILLCILENYHYESHLLQLTRSILSHEQNGLMNKLYHSNVRSTSLETYSCNICQNSILSVDYKGEKNNIILYGCKHVYHRFCHSELFQKLPKDSVDHFRHKCPLCNSFSVENVDKNGEENDPETGEIIKFLKSLGPKKVTRLTLNPSQYKALNYFHNDRFKL